MNQPLTMPSIADELRGDEGVRVTPYKDSLGRWACGVGCDLAANGMVDAKGAPLPEHTRPWSATKIAGQLDRDVNDAVLLLDRTIPWWRDLSLVRQRVMINMMFNMGWGNGSRGLSSFKNTLKAIQRGDYATAADGMLKSKWARQVGARAERLAYRMRTDNYF